MTSIIDKTTGARTTAVFQEDVRTVVVHDGTRGPQGLTGVQGPPGDAGSSIVVLGQWVSGATYCPLDAVSWRSSAMDGVTSLYIQKSDQPCSASTTPPNEDPGRWDEIGAVDTDQAFGGIWEVYQLAHGFTKVGQPVSYSYQADKYVLADARWADELATCVVREVVSPDVVLLQSSGEVPNIDPAVIYPDGSAWEPGVVYYVSTFRGRLSTAEPTDASYYSNPVLKVADHYGDTPGAGRNGIALPWRPDGGPDANRDTVTTSWNRYYYDATGGQTTFSGPDRNGNTLIYALGNSVDVFQQGLNLDETAYAATDGTTVVLTTGATGGDVVEIWAAQTPSNVMVPSTTLKIDNIESSFDGVTTTFVLAVLGIPVNVFASTNCLIFLDGTIQEANVDYDVVEDPANPGSGEAAVVFGAAPEGGTRFYGILFQPV